MKNYKISFTFFKIEIGFSEVEIWQQVWKLANRFTVCSVFNETHKNEERLRDFKWEKAVLV